MPELNQEIELPINANDAPIAIATVNGQAIVDLPKDLYIPPDAMKVFLSAFEGPLDFLLYLIRKQNIDILNIPIAEVTQQYMQYIDLMHGLTLELAAEYLVMAAILAEIKSRMLLPKIVSADETEADPRADLVRRLQEYERYKSAAEEINALPRDERDNFGTKVDASTISVSRPLPEVKLNSLIDAMMSVLQRLKLNTHHHIQLDALSVREKMSSILVTLQDQEHVLFEHLFFLTEGRLGIVVTFLAMLELSKQGIIEFVQTLAFGPIYLKLKQSGDKTKIRE